MREQIDLIIKGYKIINTFPKQILLSKALWNVVRAGVPFINIFFAAQILNELIGQQDTDRLTMLVLLAIGLNLAGALLSEGLRRWSDYCDSLSWWFSYNECSNKVMSMDYIDVEDPNVQQIHSEIRHHQNGMSFGLVRLVSCYNEIIDGGIKIIISVAFAFTMFTHRTPEGSPLAFLDSPLAVAAVLVALSGSILLAPYLTVVGGRIFAKASDINSHINRLYFYYVGNVLQSTDKTKDIRIYDQEKRILKDIAQDFKIIWMAFVVYFGKYRALSAMVTQLSNGLIYLFVALKAYAGAFGVGNIVLYVGAITQFGNGFSQVLTNIGDLKNNNPFLERTINFLEMPNNKYQGTLPIEKRLDNEYEIEFKNVSFKYPGSEEFALKNLNLKLRIGQRLAVVGMNGSGKTTMIKLLCRLYDPTEGEITLNGIDIKKYNYDEYMAIFGVVFQDFALLPFTLGENVAASVDYDKELAKELLIKSGFGDRLESMPHRLDTYLYKHFEDDGVEVSGGEAQKIALARA